jgi:hypothetical protein
MICEGGEGMTHYTAHLERKLNEMESEIDSLQKMYDTSDVVEKARILSELSQLRVLHEDLAQRVDAAKKEGSDQWSILHESFQEEADALRDTIAKWLTKLG